MPTGHDLANLLNQSSILLHHLKKGILADRNHLQSLSSYHRRRPGFTGQERHFSKKLPGSQRRHH